MKKPIILFLTILTILFSTACNVASSTTTDLNTNTTTFDTSDTTTIVSTDNTTLSETILTTTDNSKDFIDTLLDSMTLSQKAAQMVQAERSGITTSEVEVYGIGSILSGGGSHPTGYMDSADVWYEMYYDFQEAALNSETGIPLVYGIDAVHGNNNLYGATIFPHSIGLGMANNPELVYEISKATAEEMLATGITWTFAPALSVVQNIRWGRTYEGFSENPEIFLNLTQSAILGFEENGVIATAKHYLADGGTTSGIDQGNTIATESITRMLYLAPYIEAVEAGVDTVMISYSSLNGIKMHRNDYWINDVLKDELGFEGFVISDYNAIHQLDGDFYNQVKTAINSGIDMLMEPYTWKDTIDAIVLGVNNGDISLSRIDDDLGRILRVKYDYGLFDNPYYRLDSSYVNNQEHKDLAKRAARESLVLLKNDNNSLPLSETTSIFITGPGSDNVGYMCGGWTTYWQGNTEANIGTGISIKDAMQSILYAHENTLFNDYQDADNVVIVLSELPYSEGAGDNSSMTLTGGNASPDNYAALQLAKSAHEAGKNVIGILISGRPLLLEDYLQYFDSFIAAWLPGTEGGIAINDVLFGYYDFVGKLSYTWPISYEQIGYNSNDEDYDPDIVLFPYGYGLDYNQ